MAATFVFDPIMSCSWVSETLTWFWNSLPREANRKSVEQFWKETWRLRDDKEPTDRKQFGNIFIGPKKQSNGEITLSTMFNYKGPVDFMYEKQKPTHFLAPKGTLSADIPMKISGLRASYHLMHPKQKPDELKLQYEGLEHWLFKLDLPLSRTRTPTIVFGVTPIYHSFSVPYEVTLEGDLDAGITAFKNASWSLGLTRDASLFSFGLMISQSIKETEATASPKAETEATALLEAETKATASCELKTDGLTVSADWDGNNFNCSFKQEDMGFSITSACQINVKDATKSVSSVGFGKKWPFDKRREMHRGIQVVFDTHDVTTITFSQSLANKISLELSAKVDARDISHSQLEAKISFT